MTPGQKARISLARAIYSQSPIILLDDPFSVMEFRVSQNLVNKVVVGHLKTTTRILVTESYYLLPIVDRVIYIDDGEIKFQGSFLELKQRNYPIDEILKKRSDEYFVQGQIEGERSILPNQPFE